MTQADWPTDNGLPSRMRLPSDCIHEFMQEVSNRGAGAVVRVRRGRARSEGHRVLMLANGGYGSRVRFPAARATSAVSRNQARPPSTLSEGVFLIFIPPGTETARERRLHSGKADAVNFHRLRRAKHGAAST